MAENSKLLKYDNLPLTSFDIDKLKVQVYHSEDEMGYYDAYLINKKINELLEVQEEVNIVFAPAVSHLSVFKYLFSFGTDFSRVNGFHLDEYIGLEEDDERKITNFAKRHIFSKANFKNVFLMDSKRDPEEMIDEYTRLLKEHPLDIAVIGIGTNCHIAYNEPHNTDFHDTRSVKIVDIDATSIRQAAKYDKVFKKEEDLIDMHAYTMTINQIMKAKYIFCACPRVHKAKAVQFALKGPIIPKCPASILRQHDNAILLLDRESASNLKLEYTRFGDSFFQKKRNFDLEQAEIAYSFKVKTLDKINSIGSNWKVKFLAKPIIWLLTFMYNVMSIVLNICLKLPYIVLNWLLMIGYELAKWIIDIPYSIAKYFHEQKLKSQNREKFKDYWVRQGREWKAAIKKYWLLYLIFLPVFVWVIVFLYFPKAGLIVAFKNFNVFKGIWGSPWADMYGFKNFYDFFNNPYFGKLIFNSLRISFYSIVFVFPLPIILSLMINEVRSKWFKNTVQTVVFLPYFISAVVLVSIFTNLVSYDGVVNDILHGLFGMERQYFLSDPKAALVIYYALGIYSNTGYGTLIYLAALTSIDSHLYEAAKIDGATKFQEIRYITIPGIMPTIIVMLVLRIGKILNIGYETIILLYQPTTYETLDVINSYVYRLGISGGNYAYTAAVGIFNAVVSLVLVSLANKISKKTGNSLW